MRGKFGDELPDEVIAYHAFNAAVTAWHICDWVWETASVELRERFKVDSPEPSAKDKRLLTALVYAQCRELYICRQLATGAKHFRVDQFNDPGVSTSLEAAMNVFESDASGKLHFFLTRALFVNDGDTKHAGLGLFNRALDYWESFFQRYGIQ